MQHEIDLGYKVTLFLREFHIGNVFSFFLAVMLIFLLSVLRQSTSCVRNILLQRSDKLSNGEGVHVCSGAHLAQTVLHVVETILSYLLMLAISTLNVWIIVAVVSGAAAGLMLCFFVFTPQSHLSTHSVIVATTASSATAAGRWKNGDGGVGFRRVDSSEDERLFTLGTYEDDVMPGEGRGTNKYIVVDAHRTAGEGGVQRSGSQRASNSHRYYGNNNNSSRTSVATDGVKRSSSVRVERVTTL